MMFVNTCRQPRSKRLLPGDRRCRRLLRLPWTQQRASWLQLIAFVAILALVAVPALTWHLDRTWPGSQYNSVAADTDLGWEAPRWLRDYVAFSREPDTDSSRYLVWSCTNQYCGGVGDRVRGMLTAFYLAVGTGRKFRIYSTKPTNLNRTLLPAWVDWATEAEALFQAASERVHVQSSNDSLAFADASRHLRIVSVFTTAMELYPLYSAPQFADRFYGDEFRVGPENWDLLATWAWAVLFQPTPELLSEIDAVKRDAGLQSGHFVAVHVRRGGHWGDWLRHDSEGELAQFVDCAGNMTRSMGGDVLVYVASDDINVKKRFRAALDAVRYDPHPPKHIEDAADYAAQLRIWAEFMVIRQAQCIVASLSGFSLWPVMISRDPESGTRCFARFDRCSMHLIATSMERPLLAYDAPSANDPAFGVTVPTA